VEVLERGVRGRKIEGHGVEVFSRPGDQHPQESA
jgi:hypothetical protein